MSIPTVIPKYSFGLKGDVSNNISYLDEQTIIYPAGSNLIIYNVDQKTQKFISSSGADCITAMAVSPNKRYVATAEKNGEKASIAIFDMTTQRKRKTLTPGEENSQSYVSLAFSPDSKYLVSQAGAPDWMVTYWQWEKAKSMASMKGNGHTANPIYQVSFNPEDNTQICLSGEKLFKLFRYNEGNLKQFAFVKVEAQNYLCHAWLSEDRLALGTDSGKIQLFEGGELKNEFTVHTATTTGDKDSAENSRKTTPLHPVTKETVPVRCIAVYSKGFICSGGSGTVCLFEKTDNKNVFRKTQTVGIWVDTSTQPPQLAGSEAQPPTSNEIRSLTLSPSEESVICTTITQQIYSLSLSNTGSGKGGSSASFDYLTHSFHQGEITGMDVCIRKPLIATCSTDKTIRVWNYETNALDLCKEFQEEAYSIALHPSGLFLLVGFSEKLRLMNVLLDDIRSFKEFTIRGCRECSFSNGGHMFAAANTTLIQLFATYTFENIGNLKGHNGKIRCLLWNPDDSHLVSCGMDGAIYDWNVQNVKRERECVLKSCSYTSIAIMPDLRTTFAVGSDRTLKEVILADSTVLRQVSAGDVVLTQVVLSHTGKMLFVGSSSGTVRAMKFPLTDGGEYQEHTAHSLAVTRMKVSYDDQYLFSVGQDGVLFCFKVTDKDGRGLKKEKDVNFSEEVLVTKSDLEEKNTQMSELKTRVDELKMENEYQLRLKDMNYNEKTKELRDKFVQEIESLQAINEAVRNDREKENTKHAEEIQELVERQNRTLEELDNANSQKLLTEYEKYQELQARSQRLQEDYEHRITEAEDAHQKALQELTEHYESRLQEKGLQLDQTNDEHRQKVMEYDELQKQMEEDGDQEVLDLKNKYERQLRQKWEENTKLRGEAGILNKKVSSLNEEIKKLNAEIQRLMQEVKKRDNIISSLKNDIDGLKKEIQERDDTIQDKEKRIYDLKKKNQELEKFKFVLDYKIKEQQRQIEPMDTKIKRMKAQIKNMETELGTYSQDNKALQFEMEQKELRLAAADKELHQERQRNQDLRVEVKNIKCGLHGALAYIQEPDLLKKAVDDLRKKYLQDHDGGTTGEQERETDIHSEYARQREHLERSVASLRKKLAKDTEIHRADYIRVMQDNVALLKEINDLRVELKKSRTQAHDLEAAIKIARKQGFDDQAAIASAKPTVPSSNLAKVEPPDYSRLIEMQKTEISKLRAMIRDLEGGKRPLSRTKLPPMQDSLVTVQ
eukprot:Em0011g785a